MYKEQMAAVKIEVFEKGAVIKKGVIHGCSLSSLLFNLFIECALLDTKEKGRAQAKIQ